jgi:bifunctional DNA-binding transcriptional regulator/antitoxin component of YhaV-PrlF toxin-antitoxin module
MTYRTILTSKGTTTLPKEMRDQLGVKPGMLIAFTKNEVTGEYTVSRAQTIDEVRQANKQALKKAGTAGKEYYNGVGYATHVAKGL